MERSKTEGSLVLNGTLPREKLLPLILASNPWVAITTGIFPQNTFDLWRIQIIFSFQENIDLAKNQRI